ncbi:MAG: UDP-2,3-diacylglucosamine hydrolase [Candidatus Kapaibacterium sp.]|nr:MAG: UDP-2,3-diacylglucosamine hydrolase [Candidatus Kapabacteria bacterium]
MVYFLSDVHLGYGQRSESRQREQLLIELLEAIAPTAEQLFIVGDLFDYWFEYRTVIPREFFRTLAALDQLVRQGVVVEYLVGNHDFGHRDFFERELGIHIHWNDLERNIAGKRFYIAHGDGKVAGDWGYLLLRGVLRNRLTNTLYRWIHPDIGIALASLSSHTSRHYTSARDDGMQDSLFDFARAKICTDGFDVVVLGHRHRSALVHVSEGSRQGTYVNLGDWMSQPLVGVFTGERMLLEPVEKILADGTAQA